MSSVAFDKIVPFGQALIFDDIPVTLALKEWVACFLCLIESSVDRCEYSKSRFGSCPGSQFAGLFNGVEHSSAPSSGNLREESMLNGVPLGAIRRIMCNSDVYAESLGQLDKAPFPLPASGIVGTSTVAEYENGLCIRVYVPDVLLPLLCETVAGKLSRIVIQPKGHIAGILVYIVDAVRHHLAVGEGGIVMVIDFYRLLGVGSAVVASEVSKEFLLLRVNAEHGNPVFFAFLQPLGNPAKLLVPFLALCHRLGFQRLAPCVPLKFDNLLDSIGTYVNMILFGEYVLDLHGGQPEPLRVGILWKSSNVKLDNLSENGDVLGMHGERALPATSLLANSALVEVLFGMKLMTTSVDGLAVDAKDAADKAYAMYAMPVGYQGDELSRLSLVCVLEVLHLFVSYYICWNFRNLHNCLESSYKGTNFSADLRI